MQTDLKTIRNILTAFMAFTIVYLLNIFSSLLIPLLLALFMAILLQPVLAFFEKKKWPYSLSLSVISLGSLSFLALFCFLIYDTGSSLMQEKVRLMEQVHYRLTDILSWMNLKFKLKIEEGEAISFFYDYFSLNSFVKSTGVILGDFTNLFFMTALYLIVFLGGILKYEQFIHYLEEDTIHSGKLLGGFEEVKKSIATYMKVKVVVSFFTGMGYAITCWLFDLDFYLFWGVIAFTLNFIPTFGSIIATIPPLALGLIQLEPTGLIFLSAILMSIQMFFGNILEPRMLGSRLSLNTITVLLGLVFWGYLWGIIGMILSVPLLVLMKVILAQFPDARMIVRLMGTANLSKKNKKEMLFEEAKAVTEEEAESSQ